MVITAANQQFGRSRNFRNPLQKLGQLLGQPFVSRKRKTFGAGKYQIDIASKLATGSKDAVSGLYVCGEPSVAFGGFKFACRGIDRRQKFGEFRKLTGFFKLRKQFRLGA